MGTITNIEAQKKNPDRFSVFVDESYGFSVSLYVLAKNKLKVGQEISDEFLNSLLTADLSETLYSKALAFISYRPRTEKEVRDKLRLLAAKFSKPIYASMNWNLLFDATIQKLHEISLLNDENYIKQYFDSVNNSKRPPSNAKLMNFLRKKGISKELVEESLVNLDISPELEIENAQKVFSKKISKFSQKDGKFAQQDKAKIWRYMASKGYTSDTIKALFDSLSQVY
jgi:regulatory protein